MDWKTGILVTVWFLVGVVLYAILRDWQVVAAIGTWLLAGGIVFAIVQVRQMRRSTSAQVAVQLFQILREEEAVETIEKIYELGPNYSAGFIKNDAELKKKIEHVIDNLELLGALVAQRIIDKQLAIEAYSGSTALRCWYVLREYIIEERNRRRGGLYCKYLEDFAWRTWNHCSNKVRILYYEDDPNDAFDLVQHLIEHEEIRPSKRT